jgi:NOL1/NOP2/fmu family ribosome biogenesis protein
LRENAFPRQEISFQQAISYLRRDNFMLPQAPKGWNVLTYKDINLGFINNIGNRVNNYFPVEWRIRMNKPEHDRADVIKWDVNDKDIT